MLGDVCLHMREGGSRRPRGLDGEGGGGGGRERGGGEREGGAAGQY